MFSSSISETDHLSVLLIMMFEHIETSSNVFKFIFFFVKYINERIRKCQLKIRFIIMLFFLLKLKLAYEQPRIVFGCSLAGVCLGFEGLAVKQC